MWSNGRTNDEWSDMWLWDLYQLQPSQATKARFRFGSGDKAVEASHICDSADKSSVSELHAYLFLFSGSLLLDFEKEK